MEKGYLAIVLHAHLPFVRHPEYADALEENWLFEAITDTYIPLLSILERFTDNGLGIRLTLSMTPTLTSMLGDPLLQSRYLKRLQGLIELGEKELQRTRSDPPFNALAHRYYNRLLEVRHAFVDRYEQNLVRVFRRLQDLGQVEIMASAATHGYLPLLSVTPSAVRSQIRTGIEDYRHAFGRRPKGFWLPECGYYPGVDEWLAEYGIRYTILETHGITRAVSRPRYGVYGPILCPSGVAAFGRDPESSKQVWSCTEGYPGDYDYREFYRDIAYDLELDYIRPFIHSDGIRVDTGFKYFRITGKSDHKEVYVPEWAEKKAEIHAGNFMFNRQRQIEYLASVMDRKPVIVAPYDAELFGHWWFEGPRWLHHLLRKTTGEQETLRLITLSEYLEAYPKSQVTTPSCSSWGDKGFHETWLNGKNDWIYPRLHKGARSMERLAREHARAQGLTLRALKQAARELLVAQASDWAFMINRGDMAEYGTRRTKTHLSRLLKLRDQIEKGRIDEDWLSLIESQNNIFPQIDYRSFCEPSDGSGSPGPCPADWSQ
ncbi:MAG: 1,4-alpha-glucan branching protein domain-containing protein [Thermodesulfobacteriota bacterium]|nr:1,4-alpha-glucan branching protein domain-containing protein [Thermodesulfobacteriota bacterium]